MMKPKGDYSRLVSAGNVGPSVNKFIVIDGHYHKSLECGDVVVMSLDVKGDNNILIRLSDMTTHKLTDSDDQYVHLEWIDESSISVLSE